MDAFEVREVHDEQFAECAEVVRASFVGVAEEFGLTRENCPAHSSFTTADELREMIGRGFMPFALFHGNRIAGFVALEDRGDGVFWVEKVSILPEYRHMGLGRTLMEHVLTEATRAGGRTITLALIDRHTLLKTWYEEQGFVVTHTGDYTHLPFTVCFMSRDI